MDSESNQITIQTLKKQLAPNLPNLDPQVQQEIIQIFHTILRSDCNRNQLSLISRLGLLEQTPMLKSHIWKMLLGTIEIYHMKWNESRLKNKELYSALRQKFCDFLVCDNQNNTLPPEVFDRQLWAQIALDTKRTHSMINFFQTEVEFTKVYQHKITKHNDVLSRILYIWSKTNPAVKYVQGMNQILAPFYYLQFQTGVENEVWDRQSQVFAMFSAILSFVIDMHIKEMDDCDNGIIGRMIFLNRYLRVVDSQLWQRLQKQGIYPECYSFRWLALLLSQQFGIYDTIRLWDHVISYTEETRFFFVCSLCIGILHIRKAIIMTADFMTFLPLLQKLKDLDIEVIIEIGTEFYHKYKKVNIDEKYQKLQNSQNMVKVMKGKPEEIHLQRGSWSYLDILKQTTTYLAKLTTFKK